VVGGREAELEEHQQRDRRTVHAIAGLCLSGTRCRQSSTTPMAATAAIQIQALVAVMHASTATSAASFIRLCACGERAEPSAARSAMVPRLRIRT